MKTCSKCHQTKKSSEFYFRYSKPMSQCKKCIVKRVQNRYWNDYKAREKCKKYAIKHRKVYMAIPENFERKIEWMRNYRKQESVVLAQRRHARKTYWRHRKRALARVAVSHAITSGKIIKPKNCSRCGGCKGRIEAHHHLGYERKNWMKFKWLCSVCHVFEHHPNSPSQSFYQTS